MKFLKVFTFIAFLCTTHSTYAQFYDGGAEQYSYRINKHPFHCSVNYELNTAVYGGLMWSSTNGAVAGKHNLGGFDIGAKLTNAWGYTCQHVKLELNAYVDLKWASYLHGSDDSEDSHTDCAAQFTLTPGIRIKKWSLDCGPYIAYSAYKNDTEELFTDPTVSGVEYGIRLGTSLHFRIAQLGLYYDIALSDNDKKFKKNDLMLVIGINLDM